MNIIIPMLAGYFFFYITSGHFLRTLILGDDPTDLQYYLAIHFPLLVGFFITAIVSYIINL